MHLKMLYHREVLFALVLCALFLCLVILNCHANGKWVSIQFVIKFILLLSTHSLDPC